MIRSINLLYTLVLLCLCFGATAQNIPDGSTSVPGNNPITLPPPSDPFVSGGDANYIRTLVPKVAFTNAQSVNTGSAASQVARSVSYLDGFSNTFQQVTENVSVVGNLPSHLVQLYNNRPAQDQYTFLPYATGTLGLQTTTFIQQRNFYLGKYPDEGYNAYAISRNTSGNNERSLTQYAPGKSQVGQQKGTVSRKLTNKAPGFTDNDAVRIWSLDANGLPVSSAYYAANQLFGEETTLPVASGVSGTEAIRSRVYTDKEGRTILKMVAESTYTANYSGVTVVETNWLKTYYVYDEIGRLRYTIPPKAVDLAAQNGWVLTSSLRDDLCFQYQYDAKGRLTAQQFPGEVGFTEVVYDRKQRAVMRRTPLEKQQGVWEVIFHDALGRVMATSLYADAGDRAIWQGVMDNGTPGASNTLSYYLLSAAGEAPAENAIAGNTMMSYTWYDKYDITDPGNTIFATYGNAAQFLGNDLSSLNGAETPVRKLQTYGLVTGGKVRILTAPGGNAAITGNWKSNVIFYDSKGRPMYTAVKGLYQGNVIYEDYSGAQYDFNGRVLISKHMLTNHNSADAITTHTELGKNIYDPTSGSLQKTMRKVDLGPWVTTSVFECDELGRVKRKGLGNYGEVQDFDYNIRGQLTGINGVYAHTGDKQNKNRTFGEALSYDYGFTQPRLDGKIAGMTWRGSGGEKNAYGYNFDLSGRLKQAEFREWNGTSWTKQQKDYTVSGLSYDKNGNIQALNQRGMGVVNGSVVPVTMDQLTYEYGNTNRLAYVNDGATNYGIGDFENHNTGTNDYRYDNSGNLDQDLNKGITAVSYTHFNKPVSITKNTGTIHYSYDAGGSKVQELVTQPSGSKRTDYIGNFVYENNRLQYILTAEGRTVFDDQAPVPVKEEFFVKDHLGNVRSVIDVYEYMISKYLGTYELASAHLEGLLFDHHNDITEPNPDGTPGNEYVGRLNGSEPDKRIGTAMIMKVMAGDRVEMNVNNYYENYDDGQDQPVVAGQMLDAVLNTLTSGPGVTIPGEAHNPNLVGEFFSPDNFSQFDNLIASNTDSKRPRAYLNYALFDENMRLVQEFSGAFQVNGNGSWAEIGTTAPMNIPRNGYLSIYLSNGSHNVSCASCSDVFFDKVQIIYSKGNLLEETHYYPFGLPMAHAGSAAAGFKENRRKYQSNEYIKDIGLNWMDFNARQYDPQLGRFLGVDPLANSGGQDMFSPYAAMGNEPESMVDPGGMQFNNHKLQAVPGADEAGMTETLNNKIGFTLFGKGPTGGGLKGGGNDVSNIGASGIAASYQGGEAQKVFAVITGQQVPDRNGSSGDGEEFVPLDRSMIDYNNYGPAAPEEVTIVAHIGKRATLVNALPRTDEFDGFWGQMKHLLNGGNINGVSYDKDGFASAIAPIMGMPPNVGIARGRSVANLLTTSSKSTALSRTYTIYTANGTLFKFGVTDANFIRMNQSLKLAGEGSYGSFSSIMIKSEAHIMEKYLRSLHFNSTGVYQLPGMKVPFPINLNTGNIIK